MVEDLSDPHTRELILGEALAQVPGYRCDDPGIETVRLHGGNVNYTYSVVTPAGRFVLRLSKGPDAWLTSDRSVELQLHGIAAAANIAPRIVHADSRDRWLITEYIAGRLWTKADFANPHCMTRLGKTLRRLHALPPPDVGRFDLLGALTAYVRRIAEKGESGAELMRHLDRAALAIKVSGAEDRPRAILHHDLHASNLIENLRGLMLIDWECAAVGDPLWDVACILSYYDAARPHAPLLLEQSGLQHVTKGQLLAAVWLFDLHTYLWYRERGKRLSATEAELEAERHLSARLSRVERRGVEDWP
jgi:thiamine kinase